MRRFWQKRLLAGPVLLLLLLLAAIAGGCLDLMAPAIPAISPGMSTPPASSMTTTSTSVEASGQLDHDGRYTSPEEVAAYIHAYRQLPVNYITKSQAVKQGWDADLGNLWDVTDQKSIGGDRFGNREGLLPDAEGRIWYECDVNYLGGFRGAERLVFSNDGLIYYTSDHYRSFTRLY